LLAEDDLREEPDDAGWTDDSATGSDAQKFSAVA